MTLRLLLDSIKRWFNDPQCDDEVIMDLLQGNLEMWQAVNVDPEDIQWPIWDSFKRDYVDIVLNTKGS
jgi:hypothetical protein